MTLKERLLKQKSIPTGAGITAEEYSKTPDGIRYEKFLDICDRLTATVDLSEIHCSTYAEVFALIEEYNVNISDIVATEEYVEFKNAMITSKVQCCFPLGKLPDKVYDLNNVDDYIAYTKLCKEERR